MARVYILLLLILSIMIPRITTEETLADEVLPVGSSGFGGHHRVRRLATQSILTEAEKNATLDKHNELRGQVIPAAANMRFMVWDDSLATHAQRYSDSCVWAHGRPDDNITPFDRVGQNLWVIGPTLEDKRPNGSVVVQSWYNEDRYFTYDTVECESGQLCGHYTQVVWAESYAVGCGMTFCPTAEQLTTNNVWIFNCHYGVAGNYLGAKPYIAGPPCTLCSSGVGQCYNNKCRLCSTHSEECDCRSVCQNCGTLDADKCECTCPDGYIGPDCTQDCTDTSNSCGTSWLFDKCNADNLVVLQSCPDYCELCYAFPDPSFKCEPVPATTAPATMVPATTTVPATMVPATTTVPATKVPATTVPATTTLSRSCNSLICEHGGTLQLSVCKCMCKADYQGNACQHLREEARNGVLLVLVADIAYWKDIKDGLLNAVAGVLTSYCNGDAFQKCCPGKGTKKTAKMLAFVSAVHFSIATGYPEIHADIESQLAFATMLLGTPPVTSALCGGGTVSRKRRYAESPHVIHRREALGGAFLDQDIMLKAVKSGLDDIAQALSQLNVSVTVNSVEAGVEEPPPPGNNGLIIVIVVVVSIIAVVAIVVIVVLVSKHVSRNQKVTPPMTPMN